MDIVAWGLVTVTTSPFGAICVEGACQTPSALVNLASSQSVVLSMAFAALATSFATQNLPGQNPVVVGSLSQSAQGSLVQQGNAGQSMATAEQAMLIATAMRFGDRSVVLWNALESLAGMVSVGRRMIIVGWDLTIAMGSPFGQRRVVELLEVAMRLHAPVIMSAVRSMDIVVWAHLIATLNQSGARHAQISKMAAGACS